MSLRPGETVHYVALLAEDGEVILTIPMEDPPTVPKNEAIVGARVDVKVDVQLTLRATGRR